MAYGLYIEAERMPKEVWPDDGSLPPTSVKCNCGVNWCGIRLSRMRFQLGGCIHSNDNL